MCVCGGGGASEHFKGGPSKVEGMAPHLACDFLF